jgi:hypothetical protein
MMRCFRWFAKDPSTMKEWTYISEYVTLCLSGLPVCYRLHFKDFMAQYFPAHSMVYFMYIFLVYLMTHYTIEIV